jgi:hypothetical protein
MRFEGPDWVLQHYGQRLRAARPLHIRRCAVYGMTVAPLLIGAALS